MVRKSSCSNVFRGLRLGALFLIGACAGPYPTHYTVFVDLNGLTAAQEIMIDTALANWQHAVPVTFDELEGPCPDLNGNVDTICVHVVSQSEIDRVSNSRPGSFAGWTIMQRGGGESFVLNSLSGENFEKATEHELGHAQGLEHTGLGSLMYYMNGTDEAALPTATDVAQWQGLR